MHDMRAACFLLLLLASAADGRAQLREGDARLLRAGSLPAAKDLGGRGGSLPPTLYCSTPLALTIVELGAEIDAAAITDVEVADFSGDGRNDIAVAWFVTDLEDMANNQRFLTLYFGEEADGFVRAADIDLYIPDYNFEALSVFRNGSSDIGVGDFDGDGDPDLAVTVFFGDELWFIENLGGGSFVPHLKFVFGYNSPGFFQTPPEASAADFDGDGRDELVYVSDPISYWDPYIIHFWKTDDQIQNMYRVDWHGNAGVTVQWTRGLAIGDFDADSRPDLCFSGSVNPPLEDDPVLVFWYDLDTISREFSVQLQYPGFLCSDIVALQPDPLCPAGALVTDLDGTEMEYRAALCDGSFHLVARQNGYAGLAPDRGMAAELADVDGDGDLDLVTRQKQGALADANQVEITLSSLQGQQWMRVDPTPLDTWGFQEIPFSQILRPRNLAVADLFGNTLPEIVAGFGAGPVSGPLGDLGDVLRIAYWANSCVGDASVDGRTDFADLTVVLNDFGHSGEQVIDPNADLNKDDRVDFADLSIVLADYGCDCLPPG